MLDVLIAFWDEMMNNGVGLLLGFSTILVCVAIYLAAKHYGGIFFQHLIHKRNVCWLASWLIFLAILLSFFHFEIMSHCPVWIVLLMIILYGLYTIAVFGSVSGPVLLTKRYLKQYENWLREGKAYEHRDCIDTRPWYMLDLDERIEYELLRARYLNSLGDIKGAYNAICIAEEMPMYPEERVDLDINRVFMLTQMGDIPKARRVLESFETKDRPAYCFLCSFVLEQEGKLSQAFDLAIEAENAMEPGYKHLRVRTALYNHLGRMYCYRNNQTELFRYFNLAANDAKKMGDITQIHLVYKNLIDQSLYYDRPKEEVESLVNEYTGLIKTDHADGICQTINLRLRLARHYKDRKAEHDAILWGYEMLKNVSDRNAMAGHEVNMLMMLGNGHFPLEPIFADVETNFDSYFSLPMPMRYAVIWDLIHLTGLSKEQFERTRPWVEQMLDYLENQALDDLDDYQKKLPSSCVGQRCWVLISKVDVYALLGKDGKQQLQWLKELQQIYKDHGLALKEACNDAHMAKYYAQQLAFGEMPDDEAKYEIRAAVERAWEKSFQIPWPDLGNLLVEIACGYGFLKDWTQVRLVLKRFNDLGLTEEHCGHDQKMHIKHLLSDLHNAENNM